MDVEELENVVEDMYVFVCVLFEYKLKIVKVL